MAPPIDNIRRLVRIAGFRQMCEMNDANHCAFCGGDLGTDVRTSIPVCGCTECVSAIQNPDGKKEK